MKIHIHTQNKRTGFLKIQQSNEITQLVRSDIHAVAVTMCQDVQKHTYEEGASERGRASERASIVYID